MLLNRALLSAGLMSGLLFTSTAKADSARDEQWQRLLHYQRGFGAAVTSSIDSPDFFVSSQGRSDPEAEWKANLHLLQQASWTYQGKTVDPQCVFPARTLYFQTLGLLPATKRSCPEWDQFQKQLDLASMSIVFSTAYAGNSASMFGHTLLKLNRKGSDSGRGLLDYGVAFLALSDPNDGALYALKGLFGGYPGFYTIQNYYELVNQYAYSENRDLWELPIPLNEWEKQFLVAHLWELKNGASASYYFSHVNCASMLAELIDVAKPDLHIRASLSGFVMPSELVRRVAERSGPQTMEFRPSQRRRWLSNLNRLTAEDRWLYRKVWHEQVLEKEGESRSDVLDTLLDRITIEKGRLDFEQQKPLRRFEQDVLMARSALPVSGPVLHPRGDNNPVPAHAPRRFEVYAGAYDNEFLYGLKLRAGWHDLMDSSEGFEPYYHLNYFSLSLDRLRSGTTLHRADLKIAEVWSLNPYSRDEKILSWMLGGGVDYQGGERSLYFKGAGGISTAHGPLLLSLLPGLELRGNLTRDRMEANAFLRLQMLARWSKSFRSLVIVGPMVDDRENKQLKGSLENRAEIARDYQLVLSAEVTKREEGKAVSEWKLGLATFPL